MSKYSLAFLCLIVAYLLTIPASEAKAPVGKVIRFLAKSFDVAKFAYQLSSFLGLGNAGGVEDISNLELVQRIDVLINKSSTAVLRALLELPKIERISNAVVGIHSSMEDLRLIMRTTDDAGLTQAHKDEFVRRFRAHGVIQHIRYLPELLTDTIPGFDVPLIVQVKGKTMCNDVSLGNFRDFYVNLLSNGIALQATFEEITKNVTLEYVLESEWDKDLQKVQTEFDTIERECYEELYKKAMSCTSSCADRSGHGLSRKDIATLLFTVVIATMTGKYLF